MMLQGKRKWLAVIGVNVAIFGGSFILAWFDKLSPEWLELCQWLGGGTNVGFMLANPVEHIAKALGKSKS